VASGWFDGLFDKGVYLLQPLRLVDGPISRSDRELPTANRELRRVFHDDQLGENEHIVVTRSRDGVGFSGCERLRGRGACELVGRDFRSRDLMAHPDCADGQDQKACSDTGGSAAEMTDK
jgi:hypothetical protein